MKKLFFIFLLFCGSLQALHAQSETVTDTVLAGEHDFDPEEPMTDVEEPAELEKPVPRRVSNDSVRKLKARPEFAYMQYADSFLRHYQQPEEKKEESHERVEEREPSPSILDNQGLRTFYWLAAIALVLWLLYKIFSGQGSLFARNKKHVPVTAEISEEDTTGKPLEQLVDKAIKAKDYRLAIRYLYLHTLEILGEKQLILLAPQKTNYQYLRELSDKPYSSNFSKLTLQYEYVWYGEFKLDDVTFNKIHEGFKKFKSQVV
jgi:hypothetical protein